MTFNVMTTTKVRLVTCPTCKKSSEFSLENPYRPFCCKRCKMIDLGAWASEQYTIPATKNDEFNNDLTPQ